MGMYTGIDLKPYMVIEVDGLEFRWSGGQYISIGYVSPNEPREFVTEDVINTIDADDNSTPPTLDAFAAACQEYLDHVDDDI